MSVVASGRTLTPHTAWARSHAGPPAASLGSPRQQPRRCAPATAQQRARFPQAASGAPGPRPPGPDAAVTGLQTPGDEAASVPRRASEACARGRRPSIRSWHRSGSEATGQEDGPRQPDR